MSLGLRPKENSKGFAKGAKGESLESESKEAFEALRHARQLAKAMAQDLEACLAAKPRRRQENR